MQIGFLGPLEVLVDGAAIDMGGPRQQRVLACLLAATPEFLSVDQLTEEVWGELPPKTATHVISTYVSNLRKTFHARIVSDGRHHRIDVTSDEVDAVRFAQNLESGRLLLDSDPSAARLLLDEAMSTWRGRPFGDLAGNSQLLRRRAKSLTEMHLQAVEARLSAELRLGHHERVIPQLRTLAAEHPLRECLWRQLMLALYRADRQAEALRAADELRTLLRDEVGIDPAPAIRRLENRILLQDPDLDYQEHSATSAQTHREALNR